MAITIGIISQKGGVGKSTLCRLLAVEFARNDYQVKIADLDTKQATCTEWAKVRLDSELEPSIAVMGFKKVSDVKRYFPMYEMVIFDGAPHATNQTLDVAKVSDLIIIPTGTSLDDLRPTVQLAHEMKGKGINRSKIAIALMKTTSSNESNEAREYLALAGYAVLDGEIAYKTSIMKAMDLGKSPNSTRFQSVNEAQDALVVSVNSKIQELVSA